MTDWEEIYNTTLKLRSKFSIVDFYQKFAKFLIKELGWSGIFGEDRIEKYYLHKVTQNNILFNEIIWDLRKEFLKDPVKVNAKLEIRILLNNYNLSNLVGDIEITIKGYISTEKSPEFKKPEKPSLGEKILLIFGIEKIKNLLEKAFEDITSKRKWIDMSKRNFYKECDSIKNWILKYFNSYSV